MATCSAWPGYEGIEEDIHVVGVQSGRRQMLLALQHSCIDHNGQPLTSGVTTPGLDGQQQKPGRPHGAVQAAQDHVGVQDKHSYCRATSFCPGVRKEGSPEVFFQSQQPQLRLLSQGLASWCFGATVAWAHQGGGSAACSPAVPLREERATLDPPCAPRLPDGVGSRGVIVPTPRLRRGSIKAGGREEWHQ